MHDLQAYAKRSGETLTSLARQSGVSPAQMSRIANGRSRPSPEVARKIEAATKGEVPASRLLGVGEAARARPPRDLGDGRWLVFPDADGRVTLTPDIIRLMGLDVGERLLLTPGPEEAVLSSPTQALRRIQAELKALVGPGRSIVDEFIAERRAAAARGD